MTIFSQYYWLRLCDCPPYVIGSYGEWLGMCLHCWYGWRREISSHFLDRYWHQGRQTHVNPHSAINYSNYYVPHKRIVLFVHADWLAGGDLLSQIKLLFGPLVIHLVWFYWNNYSPQCWWKWWIFTFPLRGSVNSHQYSPPQGRSQTSEQDEASFKRRRHRPQKIWNLHVEAQKCSFIKHFP